MNIKDYLHLYLGCWGCLDIGAAPHFTIYDNGNWALSGGLYHEIMSSDSMSFKPILRPLSDMTDEEKIKALEAMDEPIMYAEWDFKLSDGFIVAHSNPFSIKPKCFAYLLSKHLDLFGLIEAGLALDKTNLTK